jgi:hypothetical protein
VSIEEHAGPVPRMPHEPGIPLHVGDCPATTSLGLRSSGSRQALSFFPASGCSAVAQRCQRRAGQYSGLGEIGTRAARRRLRSPSASWSSASAASRQSSSSCRICSSARTFGCPESVCSARPSSDWSASKARLRSTSRSCSSFASAQVSGSFRSPRISVMDGPARSTAFLLGPRRPEGV